MAFGTPAVGGTGYSAALGASVDVPYPTGLTANTAILMFIGQKPNIANSGTVTTPTGWTLIDSRPAGGNYGSLLFADVGNTNLYVFKKDVVTGTETGSLTVTLNTNDVTWGFMVRTSYATGNTVEYGSADGQRTFAPTSGTTFSVTLSDGAAPTNLQSGDLAVWAMCIPTDVTTPAQFSEQSVTATGTTFATAVELNEPDSTTSLDIGGYSAYALATAGSSTTSPTVSVRPSGTTTNVRGPIVLVRLREVSTSGSQTLTPALFTNSGTFYGATVGRGTINLTPALFTNSQSFYGATATNLNVIAPQMFADSDFVFAPVVTQAGDLQALTATLFTNTTTFFAATVGETPVQPILGGGSLVRPRRKFRPAILVEFPEEEVVLPDISAKTRLAALSATLSLGSVVATSPDPINARTSLAFTQIETYMRGVTAKSSWNDPSDEELLLILDFALS
jgi:hypothetical protein